ncbi:MAG: sigma-70 family RNA polymerase sigma factor [Dehalococcoidales bacterium]|nr:sigma-70 family RNA polymerase sigma factor [Dehalococcoidales bacterium]
MTSSSEGLDTITVVKQAIKGDVQAYGRLYSLYVDRIYRYVFFQVGDKMTAEDITEEVFLKSWKAISSCRGKEHTFSAWLYRIAHNHMANTFRKNRKDVSLEKLDIPDETDPAREAEKNIELQKVLEAVKNLPEPQKRVIMLKFLGEADNEEIGRIMGKRQGAVRALQMRALLNLREKFSSGVDSDG